MALRILMIFALAFAAGGISEAEAQRSDRGYSVKKKRYSARRVRRAPAPRFNRQERIGTPEDEDFGSPYVYSYGPWGNGPYQANQTLQERVTIGSPDYPVR